MYLQYDPAISMSYENIPGHALISGNCTWQYVTLHGKGDLTGVIKLRLLRWRDYPALSR